MYQDLSFFRLKHPTAASVCCSTVTLDRGAGVQRLHGRSGSCSGLLQLHSQKKHRRVSSRAGSPRGLGRGKRVIVWLSDRVALWTLGGCVVILQRSLFVSDTISFVLAFVVKCLASEFLNAFEKGPCVSGFLLTCPNNVDVSQGSSEAQVRPRNSP